MHEVYRKNVEDLRGRAERAYALTRLVRRAGGALVRRKTRFIARWAVKMFRDADTVLPLDEDWALRAGNFVPMTHEALKDPSVRSIWCETDPMVFQVHIQ